MTTDGSSPRDVLAQEQTVTFKNKKYVVLEPLKQDGDNPAFESWPLAQTLPTGGKEAKKYTRPEFVVKMPARGNVDPGLPAQIFRVREEVSRLQGIRHVPHYYLDDPLLGNNGEPIETIVIRDFVQGLLLSKWVEMYERAQKIPQKTFAGVRDTRLWFQLARKLLDGLIPIHDERLVHGDLRPRNIMLCGYPDAQLEEYKGTPETLHEEVGNADFSNLNIVYLDPEDDIPEEYPAGGIKQTGTFRRKYDSPLRLFEKAGETSSFRLKKRSPAHWFAMTDIFSMGMILFELAYGSDARLAPFLGTDESDEPILGNGGREPAWFPVNRYQARLSNRQLKNALFDAWKKRLQSLNMWDEETNLARQQFICMREVILSCLRTSDPSVTGLTGIRAILDAFDPETNEAPVVESDQHRDRLGPAATVELQSEVRATIEKYLTSYNDRLPVAIESIIRNRSYDLTERLGWLADPQRGYLRIGGREGIVETIVFLLNSLQEKECFQALLTPSFFIRENAGVYGRIWSALQLAALRGRKVEWVIAVNERELHSSEVAEVLQAHNAASRHIRRFLTQEGYPYGIFYKIVKDDEYLDILKNQFTSLVIGANFSGYQSLVNGKGMLLALDYHGEEPRISALRLWPALGDEGAPRHKIRRRQLCDAFDRYSDGKLSIRTFYR